MPNDPFVDVGDLPSLGPLRYLDVHDQAAFDAGHAPGAVRVPLDEWDAVAKAPDTGFAKTAYWDEALSARVRPNRGRSRTPRRPRCHWTPPGNRPAPCAPSSAGAWRASFHVRDPETGFVVLAGHASSGAGKPCIKQFAYSIGHRPEFYGRRPTGGSTKGMAP